MVSWAAVPNGPPSLGHCQRGPPLITVDLPGFGAHAGMPAIGTIGGFADWVLSHLTDRGITSFHLLGHSMGGMIVQEMVHRAPERVRDLILYATGATGILPGRFETIAESKRRAIADGFEPTARRIAATWFLRGDADPACQACADIAAQSAPGAMLAGLDAMQAWQAVDRLGEIGARTLVLWGDRDRTYAWAQPQQLWDRHPRGQPRGCSRLCACGASGKTGALQCAAAGFSARELTGRYREIW